MYFLNCVHEQRSLLNQNCKRDKVLNGTIKLHTTYYSKQRISMQLITVFQFVFKNIAVHCADVCAIVSSFSI